jgi:putative zinc finger/helix-turn-helix YgiT family protein
VSEKLECFECGGLVTPRVEERKEALPVRGEPTEVLARVAVCPECGADMSIEELDNATLVAAFNLYREKHGLMAPEEVKRLRERYGLGVRPFSLLLGWGEITAHRYETGSLQDAAHEAALRLAEEPANIRVYLSANGDKLTARQRARLESHLQAIEARDYGRAEVRSGRLVARETQADYGNRLLPDVAISPGETIQELLEERGIARADFAKTIGLSEGEIGPLLSGDASLTHQLATDLERVLGVPAIMWENLEAMYRALLRRDQGRSSGK